MINVGKVHNFTYHSIFLYNECTAIPLDSTRPNSTQPLNNTHPNITQPLNNNQGTKLRAKRLKATNAVPFTITTKGSKTDASSDVSNFSE